MDIAIRVEKRCWGRVIEEVVREKRGESGFFRLERGEGWRCGLVLLGSRIWIWIQCKLFFYRIS
jgi:hypothetical protein